jgi:hypothetical protein
MEPEGLLPSSQEPATIPNSKPNGLCLPQLNETSDWRKICSSIALH